MANALVQLIIWLVVIGILYAIADYVLRNLIPDPPQRIIRVVVIVVLSLAAVVMLLNLLGGGSGINMPKLG